MWLDHLGKERLKWAALRLQFIPVPTGKKDKHLLVLLGLYKKWTLQSESLKTHGRDMKENKIEQSKL